MSMQKPCVLFDSHHPKHYLTLRQLSYKCLENGIDVIWTARDKDVLVDLIRASGATPYVLTTSQKGLFHLFGELIVYDLKLIRLVNRCRPFALMGNSISITHAGKILGIPSILINDDDAKANPQYPYLGYPFASRIITPDCLQENYGPKHRKYNGLHELAYLHPRVFAPDLSIREALNMAHGEPFFLIRTVALKASHDMGAKGLPIDLIKKIIQTLLPKGRVFISSESPLAQEFEKYRLPVSAERMHDVLAACELLIGDSQTMAAEAAVLGTPSVRMNSFVERISYLNQLEHRYGLTYGFKTDNGQAMLDKIELLLSVNNLAAVWKAKQDKLLKEMVDPTEIFWNELKQFI